MGFANDQDRRQAFADGVFLLTIPAELDITAADQFASEFYRGDASPYGHFKNIRANQFDDELLGFHQRVDQIEQFLLERRFWSRYYPTEITRIAEKMTELSRLIPGRRTGLRRHTETPLASSHWLLLTRRRGLSPDLQPLPRAVTRGGVELAQR